MSVENGSVHPGRTYRPKSTPDTPLLPLLIELYGHCGREFELNSSDMPELSSSHSHVFFGLQPVLHGSLPLLGHYA